MLLVQVALYWLAFALLGLAIVRRSPRLAMAVPLLGLMPPAFVFVGIIWRDVLFSAAWLLAAVLVLAAGDCGKYARLAMQAAALVLLAFGVLLRPNALLAAPVLAAFIVWPASFHWKRAALLYLPAAVACFALVQIVYYDAIGAERQHPLQSIMVFDLGGITHFAHANQFPVAWPPQQASMLTDKCYQPVEWNIYWTDDLCRFVMERLEADKIFGTPKITQAWRQAVTHHPIAYLQHRFGFFWHFLAAQNFSMWTFDLDHPSKTVFADNPAFMATVAIHDALLPTPLFRAGVWLLIDLIVCAVAWPRRLTPEGAFALGTCGAAAIYMLTFLPVGVASDFRYAHWSVLAGLAGGAVMLAERLTRSA